ncbi:MAG: molecular chaperone DnaJ [Deltaproteobacteria bacterium]|nr:MAG: molecular chaperone DnaJ [Deltaproteobacteria bacterium]
MARQRRDYYEVLGVSRDADAKTIKNAFRKLALRYHPDRSQEPDAEEHFKEIAEAYAVLRDPQKRADYDARGFAGVPGVSPEDLFTGLDFDDLFGGLGFGSGAGPEGLFERIFGRRRAAPTRGDDFEIWVEVSLERVLRGGEESIRTERPRPCAACGGSGAKAGTSARRCAACNGTGQRVTTRMRGDIRLQQISTCPTCHGRGESIPDPCPACAGRGETRSEDTLRVRIPVGVEDGMRLRIPGKGGPGPRPGDPAGDLYVSVRTAPDPRFERRGADLWREQSIELTDAVLGNTIEVATLDGSASVQIPAGAQPDRVFRLRGKGLPTLGGGARGHLYLKLRVRIPEHLSREEQQLYERLRALAHGRPRRGD